jgi:hypothetical protein
MARTLVCVLLETLSDLVVESIGTLQSFLIIILQKLFIVAELRSIIQKHAFVGCVSPALALVQMQVPELQLHCNA